MKFCASLHSDQVDSGDEFASGAGIAASARAAEAAGFDAVYVTEHPIPNDSWLAEEGHHALDPFVTLAVAAAATSSLRVLTYLCVVPYHNPYVLAKTTLTVDVLSGGRFVFGGGAGYLEPEFAAVGASFDDRNDRFDAAITTMKEVWSRDSVPISASGVTHTMRPRPVHQPHPPLWLGGNSRRALRRAVQLGDGWIPFLHPPGLEARHRTPELSTIKQLASRFDELHELEATTVASCRTCCSRRWRKSGITAPLASTRDAFRQVVQEYESLGVTMTLVYIPAGSRAEYCDLLASFGRGDDRSRMTARIAPVPVEEWPSELTGALPAMTRAGASPLEEAKKGPGRSGDFGPSSPPGQGLASVQRPGPSGNYVVGTPSRAGDSAPDRGAKGRLQLGRARSDGPPVRSDRRCCGARGLWPRRPILGTARGGAFAVRRRAGQGRRHL